ncbi:MAG: MBL fold metallo-hydrolase [Candidatus Omnitrophica bacterium]|nr:MBL fold metallo-hydrolase [Candidatus Omnitrophota bacterium]
MKIKIIATGSSKWERFIRRWGVSCLIGEDVLFDTFGDQGVLLNNMRKFNSNAAKIRHIVLSHDDWDHIAGLWYLIPNRKDITVYVCPGFKQEIKDRIASFGVKLIEAEKTTLIKEDIYSTGELYGELEGSKIYEQSVVIKTADGLAIICGCAHPGIEKIIDSATKQFNKNIFMIVGGLHLKNSSEDEIAKVIEFLRRHGVQKVAPMHCTGKFATNLIKRAYGDYFMQIKQGSVIEV